MSPEEQAAYERGRTDAMNERDRAGCFWNLGCMIVAFIFLSCCGWACHVFDTQVK